MCLRVGHHTGNCLNNHSPHLKKYPDTESTLLWVTETGLSSRKEMLPTRGSDI